jgi:hypothetical protein
VRGRLRRAAGRDRGRSALTVTRSRP